MAGDISGTGDADAIKKECTRPVSGITFIRYTHHQKIGKPNEKRKTKLKGLNRIARFV